MLFRSKAERLFYYTNTASEKERKTRMEKVKEQYKKSNKVYAQLSAENKQKINRLIAETLARQQSQRQ